MKLIGRACLAASLGIGACQLALAGDATLSLPESEALEQWESAAELTGLDLTHAPRADAVLLPGEPAWRLRVQDAAGEVQEVTVDPPVTEADREEIAWLAKNLLTPVVLAVPDAVPPAPRPEPTPPVPAPRATGPPNGGARLGLGVVVGAPTGLSAKLRFGDGTHAIEAAAGAALAGGWTGHAGYLLRPSLLPSPGSTRLSWHLGAGVWGHTEAKPGQNKRGKRVRSHAGLRAPAGLDLALEEGNGWAFFAQVAPVLQFDGNVGVGISAAAGVRYFLARL